MSCKLGLAFTRSNSHKSLKPHLHKVMPCGHPYHTCDLGLGTLYEVVSPNFQSLDG